MVITFAASGCIFALTSGIKIKNSKQINKLNGANIVAEVEIDSVTTPDVCAVTASVTFAMVNGIEPDTPPCQITNPE